MSTLDLRTKTASATFSALILVAPAPLLPGDTTVSSLAAIASRKSPYLGVEEFVRLPEVTPLPTKRVQVMIRDIRAWTGWSDRRMASAMRVTHPTVAALAKGTSSGRPTDVEWIAGLHDVVWQVHLLSGKDPTRTDQLLTAQTSSRMTPLELISNGDLVSGYLATLDLLRPRPASKLITSRLPKAVRGTVALYEE